MAHRLLNSLISFFQPSTKLTHQLLRTGVFANDLMESQLCYLGEKHHCSKVLQSQLQILNLFRTQSKQSKKIAIVMEMFAINQQKLINQYFEPNDNSYSLSKLQTDYDATGTEGFDIANHYGAILEFAKDHSDLFSVFAGFPPRNKAKLFLNSDLSDDGFWRGIFEIFGEKLDKSKQTMIKNMILNGTEAHYQYFHYLLSDELLPFDQMNRNEQTGLFEKYGKIFVAQCFKDTMMAYRISELLMSNEYDKIVCIAGHGHLDCGYGVSERVKQFLQYENDNKLCNVNEVILTVEMKSEMNTNPFLDRCANYILFLDDADIE